MVQDLRGSLGDVDVPALVVVGRRDRLVDPRWRWPPPTSCSTPGSVVFHCAGHAVMLERHAAVTRRIAPLARRVLVLARDTDLAGVADGTAT